MDKIAILENKLSRTNKAKEQAEHLLEDKSRELFYVNSNLKILNESLQKANEEIQQHQQQLVQNEKLSSLGILAAGLAHEINNPLGFIISNIDTLEEYCTSLYRVLKAAKEINNEHSLKYFHELYNQENANFILEDLNEIILPVKEGLKRISDTIKNIKVYSRVDELHSVAALDINESISLTIKLLEHDHANGVIHFEPGDIPPIYANGSEIGQVITNIIINAQQSLDKPNAYIKIKTLINQKDQVIITIEDNGKGIPDDIKYKIFNPFFTTKSEGSNSGLGLAICSKIIKQHGGTLDFTSKENEGTQFTISLPLNNPAIKEVKVNG